MAVSFDAAELALLDALSARFPTAERALAEAAALSGGLTLPTGTIHVISDVHGEYKKLRHVINNASGSLRQLVETLFRERLDAAALTQLIHVLYYPREMMRQLSVGWPDRAARLDWARRTLRQQFEIVRALARNYRDGHVTSLIPAEHQELFEELLNEAGAGRRPDYVDAMLAKLAEHESDLASVRAASRLVRNLTVSEIIVAGDLGDRGPRIDSVIEYMMQQPRLSVVWGNHDVSWMGACLGHEALIATVLRFSMRYGRLAQLEEGYGIVLTPLEELARKVYGDDPAEQFERKIAGAADPLLLARMQKAITVMLFKLEAATIRRHPEWEMEHRNLLHRLDLLKGTVEIDGRTYPLADRHFPTISGPDPYTLTPDERACMDLLRKDFVASARLWEQMSFVVRRGTMWTRRDDVLIFHACVPVDEAGRPQSLTVDGVARSGRALFDAIDSVVRRAFRKGADKIDADADLLWYLWAGPRSPLFGKDKLATFEGHFVADAEAKEEHKNRYFELIHDADFVRRLGADFGMGGGVLIVNGHVPVKIETGEQPVKRGGNAVTIDGAFSEAYGDHGYTLIIAPGRIALAELHHFDSVADVLRCGSDIVPKVTTIKAYPIERKVADTEEGDAVRQRIKSLERLVCAYEEGALIER